MKTEQRWYSVNEKLPDNLKTVFISNGKGWTSIGCLSYSNETESWLWGETNGIIYQEGEEIISECETGDLDVRFWHPFPKAIDNKNIKLGEGRHLRA